MKKKRANDPTRFVKKHTITKAGELAETDVYYLDEKAIAEDAQYDGFYGTCTGQTWQYTLSGQFFHNQV